MEITKVLMSNYLPYAKGTIMERAIPGIDGLKPANRKILYTMYKMGLLKGDKTKSSNIVGQTMKYNPHGDMSIYDTLVRMTVGAEYLNAPYIDNKGNFGKSYSRDLAYAAPRYTEAKLKEICSELFDNIDEDAVDFVNNFDDTTTEPVLLPVKFPSLLVNTSKGIAVAMSSAIPSFGLRDVCKATAGILNGTVTDCAELMEILGAPQFTTGGHIHMSEADKLQLAQTGKGTLIASGTVTTYPNRIEITEIPYRTTAEKIKEQVIALKNTEFRDVEDIDDQTDLKGFKMVVAVKPRGSSAAVLKKLCRFTDLRMSISFETRVIVGEECKKYGLLDLLHEWIQFRMTTLQRIYNYKLATQRVEEHLLEGWDKIKLDIRQVAMLIAEKDEDTACSALMEAYGLDEIQANHLLDMRLRRFTQGTLDKKLAALAEIRLSIAEVQRVLSSDAAKKKIIIDDLERIGAKYGEANRTRLVAPVSEIEPAEEEEVAKIDDSIVSVLLTKQGYLKRLVTLRDETNIRISEDDDVQKRWRVRNNSHILVFTCSGDVHKILVDGIDASRALPKEKVFQTLGLRSERDIIMVDAAGDYTGSFNIIYHNGRGTRVMYTKAIGNRPRYKSLYTEFDPAIDFVTKANKFFMITARRKAAYCDLDALASITNRVAFKVARVESSDRIFGIQPEANVPDISAINLDRYRKEYCISIGKDILWEGPIQE